MQQIGIRGDVDTSKYESWPLLRPDELEALPSGVLRASATDLDHMCRQDSGNDPIVAYAWRQRERTRAVLVDRAAQARVQALLAGTEFIGRERLVDSNHQAARAPEAHVEPSPDPRYVWSRKDSTEDYPRSQPDPALDAPIGVNSVDKRDEGGTAEQSLRSPPRLQPCRGQDGTRVAALADTTALNETGGNAETTLLRDHSEGHGGQSSRVAQEGHGGLAAGTVKQEQQGSASKGAAAATDTKFLAQQQPAGSGENMRRRKKHVAATVAQNLGSIHAASASDANNNCAVRDNWGSVFIVGGGRRRRRPAVRQRPSEIEETPAARRAQMEKERQERRKASLQRLTARKEQRAKQQEVRRKRRAAAARAAALTAAATADAVKIAAATPALEMLATGVERHQSSCATVPARRIPALPEGGKEGVGTEGEVQGVRMEGVWTPSTKVQVEKERRRSSSGLASTVDNDATLSGQTPDQHRFGLDNPTALGVSGAALPPATGRPESSGKEENLTDTAATAASMELAVRDSDDGCYSSGSESESVSGGDSSDEDDLSIDASEADEEKDKTASELTDCTSNQRTPGHAREGLGRENIPSVDMIQKAPLGGDKDDGRVNGAGLHAINGGTGGSGREALIEESNGYPSALIHDKRPNSIVEEHLGAENSSASGDVECARSRRREENPLAPNRPVSACDVGRLEHDGLAPAATAESLCDRSYVSEDIITEEHTTRSIPLKRDVKHQAQFVAAELGATTTSKGASLMQAKSREVDAGGLKACSTSDCHEKIVTGAVSPGSDGSDSGMEWEEDRYNRDGHGALHVGCDEMSRGGYGKALAMELPGPLDVQPLDDTRQAERGLSSGNRGSNTGEGQPLLTSSAGESQETRISARSSLDFTAAASTSTAHNHHPKALCGVHRATLVPTSPPTPTPLGSRETCSESNRHKVDHVVVTGINEPTLGVEQPRNEAIMKSGDAQQQLPHPPAMETGTHAPRKKTPPEHQEFRRRGRRAGGRGGVNDPESPDPELPTKSYIAKLQPEAHDPYGVTDADSSTHMIDATSFTYVNASNRTFVQAPQERQRRDWSAVSRFSENPTAPASDGASKGSRFEAAGGIKAGWNASRICGSSVRLVDCYPRLSAILTAYHNGRALTRQADCRSLPLTSKAMPCRMLVGHRGGTGSALTAAEEEACLRLQWKLYAIHLRVIKDYATVFSYGDGWSTDGAADDHNSLVYSGDSTALHYRVNSKARPEVYNIVTDVLNNRCEEWEELPTGLGLKTTWNLLWTWSKPHIRYSSLLAWQKVNHFPNSRELTRKDLLNKHVSRFMAPGGRLAKEFHIMPQTFVLPHEFTLFVAAFTSSGRTQRDRKENAPGGRLGCNGGASVDDDEDGGFTYGQAGPSSNSGKGKNLWIMKPVGMSRGRGIRLIDDIKNICYADKVVLQRYIGNPLLLDGYKFDLRLYVLVTSFNKLEAFIYKEGFARLSTHRYEKGDIDNRFIHLTNSSIQRLNEAGAARDSPLHHAKTSEAGGTKTTLSYLWRRLAASGVDVGALWAGICSLVVKSLVCVEGSIPNQPNRLRPWLIEVNSSPSMARDTHVDRQVKEALIFETVHLVDPLPFDRQKLVEILGRRLSDTQHSKAKTFKQWHHHRKRQTQQSHSPQNVDSTPEMGDGVQKGEASRQPSCPPARAPASEEQHHQHHQRPRLSKEEAELEKDLDEILCGRRPRRVGEKPARMGNFVRLCPGTTAYRNARRLRRKVIRPRPGDDGDEPASNNPM